MHVVIVGGGATLAQPVIRHFLNAGHRITAVCRTNKPDDGRVRVVWNVLGLGDEIDILITMTGAARNARLLNMQDEHWDQGIADNLTSVFKALRALGPRMKAGGNVVVVGSIQGSEGGFGCANYAAAKAGLVGLVRAAANEWATGGICVNLLELGFINAGMGKKLDTRSKERALAKIPLGRFGTEEDVVAAVDYLSRVRYMTGNVLTLAGGLR